MVDSRYIPGSNVGLSYGLSKGLTSLPFHVGEDMVAMFVSFRAIISQKVFIQSFCKSQSRTNPTTCSFILVIKNKLTNLCRN